jgi:membrane protease YdiL (CAAX protease family)
VPLQEPTPNPSPGSSPGLPPPDAALPSPAERDRVRALTEVVLCSGLPTQLVIGQGLALLGLRPLVDGVPQPVPLALLALLDSVVLIALILALLRARGESPVELIIGRRSPLRESLLGLLLVPALFVGVGLVVLTLRAVFPWTHNVPVNPFEQLMRTTTDAVLFGVVVIVAGGLREEIQRAFLLRRFEVYLGGPVVGLLVVSVGFGLGHALQGWDAAIVTALLGYTWGVMYFRRRSAVAPIVSHAGYNVLQIVQVMVLRGMHLPG